MHEFGDSNTVFYMGALDVLDLSVIFHGFHQDGGVYLLDDFRAFWKVVVERVVEP